MEEESQAQQNNFQPDKNVQGEGQDLFVRDGKVFCTAADAASRCRLGYSNDHVARLARQGKVLGFYAKGKWFVNEDSLEEYRKLAEENRRNAGLKAVSKISGAVLSSRLQDKIPGPGWGSSLGDGQKVLSENPPVGGESVLSVKPVIDNYVHETGFGIPEAKTSRCLSSGYARRAVNRAVIVLAALLIFIITGTVARDIKNGQPDSFGNFVESKINSIAFKLPASIFSFFAQINEFSEQNELFNKYDKTIQSLQELLENETRRLQELTQNCHSRVLLKKEPGAALSVPAEQPGFYHFNFPAAKLPY